MSLLDREVIHVPPDECQRPILEVADELGIEYERSGNAGWYGALCPVHDDRSPSLRLNEAGFWTCLACSQGGSAAHLYQFVTGCSMAEAVKAVLREGVDALEVPAERENSADAEQSIVALQKLMVDRLRSDDVADDFPLYQWCLALQTSDDHTELLEQLRLIV